jgi:hypothetical protein
VNPHEARIDDYMRSHTDGKPSDRVAPEGTTPPRNSDGSIRQPAPARSTPNLDSNASGAALPDHLNPEGGRQMTDQIRDNGAEHPNPGLSASVPDVQFMGGDITPTDFSRRDPLTAGHQRRSPGDGKQDGGAAHRAFFEKEAEVGASDLGPGILPTLLASSPTPNPTRAADFVRGDIGTANSSGVVRRAPLSASDPLFTGGRERGDMLQSDGQPSPMAGKPVDQLANTDDSGLGVVRPQIDDSPSLGGNLGGIFKDAGRVARGGHVIAEEAPGEAAKVDPGFGRVTSVMPRSNRIARAASNAVGWVNGREAKVKKG